MMMITMITMMMIIIYYIYIYDNVYIYNIIMEIYGGIFPDMG